MSVNGLDKIRPHIPSHPITSSRKTIS
jgi:hypothetical protein